MHCHPYLPALVLQLAYACNVLNLGNSRIISVHTPSARQIVKSPHFKARASAAWEPVLDWEAWPGPPCCEPLYLSSYLLYRKLSIPPVCCARRVMCVSLTLAVSPPCMAACIAQARCVRAEGSCIYVCTRESICECSSCQACSTLPPLASCSGAAPCSSQPGAP